ncbi:Hypothetical predicted protein [Octopus vulgaris]|uniref:Uncharacterized protein n=1 Tax=Octopus vulgaris TaxID=6645 RepID=A0AA36FB56_OCTVU|nr:Hypothetical predicted protein [Octopus vulgaris]
MRHLLGFELVYRRLKETMISITLEMVTEQKSMIGICDPLSKWDSNSRFFIPENGMASIAVHIRTKRKIRMGQGMLRKKFHDRDERRETLEGLRHKVSVSDIDIPPRTPSNNIQKRV